MSWQACDAPATEEPSAAAVTRLLRPRPRDLGAFEVRRALPAAHCRAVGPFVFFDQMGPVRFAPGEGLDVRPHPHIGLATITWLVQGEIRHQDSLGNDLVIRPGEVNWMTAGRGIVHSERTPAQARDVGASLSGIQAWVALPLTHAETAPSFEHYGAERIPVRRAGGVELALIVGRAFGLRSPVHTFSETLYAELRFGAGAALALPDAPERGVYVIAGVLELEGQRVEAGTMAVLRRGARVRAAAAADTHAFLIGGAPLDGPRILWWNFVAASEERLAQAREDWRAGRFPELPGDPEFIPLPES